LPDNELTAYVNKTVKTVIANGQLEGILLTGLGPMGIELFKNYLDCTADVQTVCLVFHNVQLNAFGQQELKLVQNWMSIYRELLDSWQL